MLNKLIKLITDKLVARCERLNRVYYITGGVNGKTVYLVRYIVFKSSFGCVYVHRFLRSDADDPHDHPWNFFTYVIEGGYKEVYYDKSKPVIDYKMHVGVKYEKGVNDPESYFKAYWTHRENVRLPGSLAYRRATDIHKVVVDKQLELEYTGQVSEDDKEIIKKAPYTICIIGKRRREWGFWKLQYGEPDGSVFFDWRRYLGIKGLDDPRIEGGE